MSPKACLHLYKIVLYSSINCKDQGEENVEMYGGIWVEAERNGHNSSAAVS